VSQNLSQPVPQNLMVQGQDSWRVTYSSLQICAYKGSTVEMNCTFTYPERIKGEVNSLQKTFWFRGGGGTYKDVETDSEYSGRVKNICDENKCTLRITNLRETDSTVYWFRFIINKDSYHGHPGVTLSVTDLQVKVMSPSAEIVEGSSVTLTCSSDANPAPEYTWYKVNGRELSKESELVFSSVQSSDSGRYYCKAKNDLGERTSGYPTEHYASKLPSVSVSPSAEIVEGSSVTLTCSSDANPAATFKWYKRNQIFQYLHEGAQLVFNYIQPSASGEYYCGSENKLGRKRSNDTSVIFLFFSPQNAPTDCSASVSPAGEIRENSSVTLTCSCDANPAPEYTWFKKNNNQPLSREAQLVFSSIKSSDSGEFSCKAENDLGKPTYKWISIDVKCE
uniref:B-cell receptor CD22 n=1 Tax=Labrus bergylta TaxID=56723 RepID=A0A3Q3FDH7_9LABR